MNLSHRQFPRGAPLPTFHTPGLVVRLVRKPIAPSFDLAIELEYGWDETVFRAELRYTHPRAPSEAQFSWMLEDALHALMAQIHEQVSEHNRPWGTPPTPTLWRRDDAIGYETTVTRQ